MHEARYRLLRLPAKYPCDQNARAACMMSANKILRKAAWEELFHMGGNAQRSKTWRELAVLRVF